MRDAAGVEGDALADEGKRLRVLAAAAAPFHCMTTRRGGRALPCPTPSNAPMPSLAISFVVEHLDLDPELGKGLRRRREALRIDDVGRLGDEIAREEYAVCDARQRLEGLARPGGGRHGER